MALFNSLKIRPFLYLWLGQTISRLGDSLYRLALSWWVLEKTGSAAQMGTVLIFSTLPMIVFLLIGGVVVDRAPRVRLMFFSDLLRGVISIGVGILALTGDLEIWHIYIASILFGFVDAFFQPAYTALVPDLVPATSLPSANSLTNLSGQAAGIFGPALAGAIVFLGGTSLAFLLDGASFILSAFTLLPLLKHDAVKHAENRQPNALVDLREGLRLVLQTPWLWISILIFSFANITFSGPYTIALPFLCETFFSEMFVCWAGCIPFHPSDPSSHRS